MYIICTQPTISHTCYNKTNNKGYRTTHHIIVTFTLISDSHQGFTQPTISHRLQYHTSVSPQGVLDPDSSRLVAVIDVVDSFHQLLKQKYNVPVEFGRALDIATFPLFLDNVSSFSPGNSALFRKVVLVTNNKYRHVVHITTFQNLIPERFDVLEALL
jgi:hypothetical protein